MGRKSVLSKYTREEVTEKVFELGAFKKAAEFYGVHYLSVMRYTGKIHHRGIKPEDEADIIRMAKTHSVTLTAEITGYRYNQIEHFYKTRGIAYGGRKPRLDSSLTHYEMHNMDSIVKNYRTLADCAEDHGVCTRTIEHHLLKCRKNKQ